MLAQWVQQLIKSRLFLFGSSFLPLRWGKQREVVQMLVPLELTGKTRTESLAQP